MDSKRADTIEAFEEAVATVPIVAAIYDHPANVPPPSGKVTVEISLDTEGPNERANGGRPNPGVFNHPLRVVVRITGSVPRDMNSKRFEREVVKPVQHAIANSPAVMAIDDEAFLEGVQWEAFQDSKFETLSAVQIWKLTYTEPQSA